MTDFLDAATLRAIIDEFPTADSATWTAFRHFNENKAANNRLDALPPATRQLVAELQAPPFLAWLEELTGFRGLVPDETLAGCGLHASTRGGFLNVHADFLAHHHRPSWRRRVNLIIYLNEGWQEEWGGALELWDRSMQRCVVRIPPLANHAVIFNTTETAYHGHPEPLVCPEGVQRKSLALSYYTIERPGTVPAAPTRYLPCPTDSLKRRALIWLDTKLVALYSRLKPKLGVTDQLAGQFLRAVFPQKKAKPHEKPSDQPARDLSKHHPMALDRVDSIPRPGQRLRWHQTRGFILEDIAPTEQK